MTCPRRLHLYASEYNAKGQMVKQYQNTGDDTENTAPTLFEYDSFGNQVKQTIALVDTPTKDNSPIGEMSYSVESAEDGVYSVTTQTRYNAAGQPLTSTQKQLISQVSPKKHPVELFYTIAACTSCIETSLRQMVRQRIKKTNHPALLSRRGNFLSFRL